MNAYEMQLMQLYLRLRHVLRTAYPAWCTPIVRDAAGRELTQDISRRGMALHADATEVDAVVRQLEATIVGFDPSAFDTDPAYNRDAAAVAIDLVAGVIDAACRICGCTDEDCRGCIERTGGPCHWVEADLCSACAEASPGDRLRLLFHRRVAELTDRPPHEVCQCAPGIGEVRADGLAWCNGCRRPMLAASVGELVRWHRDALAEMQAEEAYTGAPPRTHKPPTPEGS